jgi:hypothetical protein
MFFYMLAATVVGNALSEWAKVTPYVQKAFAK